MGKHTLSPERKEALHRARAEALAKRGGKRGRPLAERMAEKEARAQRAAELARLRELRRAGEQEPPPKPFRARKPASKRPPIERANPNPNAPEYAVLELLGEVRGLVAPPSSTAKATAPLGPPAHYDPLLAETVCQLIAEGKGLPEICEMPGMPSHRYIVAWTREVPECKARYEEARGLQGDFVADQHLRLARRVLAADPREAQAIRIAADILAKQAEWRAPRKFGPRMDLTVSEAPKSAEQIREEVIRLQEELGVVEAKRIH